mmetsp:Transcript_38621/g.106361  ORF Transcript_38621/g.106361 Transcript_38621/m.106361 type:complete len:271 (-) Transcript_38621:613-1425(-)
MRDEPTWSRSATLTNAPYAEDSTHRRPCLNPGLASRRMNAVRIDHRADGAGDRHVECEDNEPSDHGQGKRRCCLARRALRKTHAQEVIGQHHEEGSSAAHAESRLFRTSVRRAANIGKAKRTPRTEERLQVLLELGLEVASAAFDVANPVLTQESLQTVALHEFELRSRCGAWRWGVVHADESARVDAGNLCDHECNRVLGVHRVRLPMKNPAERLRICLATRCVGAAKDLQDLGDVLHARGESLLPVVELRGRVLLSDGVQEGSDARFP